MKKYSSLARFLVCFTLAALFFSCKDGADAVAEHKDSVNVIINKNLNAPAYATITTGKDGIIGVFNVPEMLALCKMDSTSMENISTRITQNFGILEKDLKATNSIINKSQGIIYYVSKPGNLKFECFLLIKKMPETKPTHSDVVVLEACNMVIYDHYGADEETFKAYDVIKDYCKKNKLEQSGPMRELYPVTEKEAKTQEAWFTRIMVPVIKVK